MKRSFGTKLVLAFLFMTLLMAAVGAFSIYSLNQLNASTDEILRREQPVLTDMAAIQSATLFHSLKIGQYTSTGNKAHLHTLDALETVAQTYLADLEQHSLATPDEALVGEIREAYDTYISLSTELLVFYQDHPSDTQGIAGRQLRINALLENALLAKAGTLYGEKQTKAKAMTLANQQLYSDYVRIVIIVSVLLTLLAIGFGFLISRSIILPVTTLIETTKQVAAGDLAARAHIRSGDEIEILAQNFNTMTTQVHELIESLEQRVAERTAALSQALAMQQKQAEELRESLATQQQLNQIIADLSVPIIPLRNDTLIVPLVGTIDAERTERLLHHVLQYVEQRRTRTIFLDVTGVAIVDTQVAHALLRTAQAVRLLGATPILAGIRPEVAQTLISLGTDLSELSTVATLELGLEAISRAPSFDASNQRSLPTRLL